jgi:hypothetical protein
MTARRLTLALVLAGAAATPADWSEPVEVRHQFQRCVSYRAKLEGDYLVVQATHEPPWRTYAMDNKRRAAEKLAGRQSLGIDAPTEIRVTQGLEVVGPWRQSPPKDLSKPDLQWFTWGFEGEALFAAKVRRAGGGPARIEIEGQACTDTACKQIEVAISLPLAGASGKAAPPGTDMQALVPVR